MCHPPFALIVRVAVAVAPTATFGSVLAISYSDSAATAPGARPEARTRDRNRGAVGRCIVVSVTVRSGPRYGEVRECRQCAHLTDNVRRCRFGRRYMKTQKIWTHDVKTDRPER